jgi:Fe2+ transport system protein FeoA
MSRWLYAFSFVTILALVVSAGAADRANEGVRVDKSRGTITIDAKIAPRKINDPRYTEIYPVEVIACYPFPRGKKAHETVVTIEAKPSAVHKALESLGLKPGTPARVEKDVPKGPAVRIFLEVPGADGQPKKVPIEQVLLDRRTNKKMPKLVWRFTGSTMTQPDPNKPNKEYGADLTGTLIAIFPVTHETVFQSSLTLKEENYVKLETNKKLLPKEGTAVKLILQVSASK